jgi:hypothetical protein
MVPKRKTDMRDAAHLLELPRSGRILRLWRPTMAERDLRQAGRCARSSMLSKV